MNPIKAQRVWHSQATKWINANPYGSNFRRPRKPKPKRKIKKGIFINYIPVEVVNAVTGEVAKGYMRDMSIKRLRKWLEFHNHRAQVEQVFLPEKHTLAHLNDADLKDFPILIKLGKYQVPYLIEQKRLSNMVRNKPTVTFDLKTADNLKYLEVVAERKEKVMKLFNKIKKAKKRNG